MNINKRKLWRYVNLKIKRLIHHYHVFSIISILFEEMIKDLKDGKEIKISNFGTFTLKNSNRRFYHNVAYRKVMPTNGHKLLRFSLAENISKKLTNSIDLDKKNKEH